MDSKSLSLKFSIQNILDECSSENQKSSKSSRKMNIKSENPKHFEPNNKEQIEEEIEEENELDVDYDDEGYYVDKDSELNDTGNYESYDSDDSYHKVRNEELKNMMVDHGLFDKSALNDQSQMESLYKLLISSPALYNTWFSGWLSNMNLQQDKPNLQATSSNLLDLNPPVFQKRIGHPYQNRNPPKRKKPRTSFNRPQIVELEKRFMKQKYLASSERSSLAKLLKMTDAQVKTWFQNRRTKWRRQNAEEKEAERQAANKLLLSLKQQGANFLNTPSLVNPLTLDNINRSLSKEFLSEKSVNELNKSSNKPDEILVKQATVLPFQLISYEGVVENPLSKLINMALKPDDS